jgi:aminoglycoside phosphotransferase (APT) family kinase protein
VNEVVEAIVGAPVYLEQLKHKRGRRRTARARGPRGSAIVKVYASGRAAVVARRVESLAVGPEEPLVPTVLHVDPGLRLVVLTDLPGRPLREALLEGDLATCARVGSVLGAWHAAWHGAPPRELDPHTAEREVEILRSRAEAASPPVAWAVEDALSHLTGKWECTTVVHRDLYEEQVLVEEHVGLIDLDDAALGPPELDVGNLVAHIELLELRRERDLAAEIRALLDGYAETGPELDGALLDRCRRLTLLRLACLNDDVRLSEAASATRVVA